MKEKIQEIIDDAVERNASDIHFIPNESCVFIKFRVEGRMINFKEVSISEFDRMLAYMKFISKLDVSERKKAQSGLFKTMSDEEHFNIRLSTLPQSIGNEAAVLRVLPVTFKDQHQLSYHELYQTMKLSDGLLLITGPTGSGKSTLMYHLLKYARDELNRQIITIEDPVEQQLSETIQINVNEKADITYQNSFKAILRCDPDIVMIGEIRDKLTAKQVINAALSGHLIISTLHASDTAGAVERLLEMGIQESELRQTVKMITSQRLVSTISGRQLLIEMMNNGQLVDMLNHVPLNMNTLNTQIIDLYRHGNISLEELERFDVQKKSIENVSGRFPD